MTKRIGNNTILILGASGFIGNALYKELLSYFDVYGTYCRKNKFYSENHVFFQYCVEEDNLLKILEEVKPNIIISALRGDFKNQLKAHRQLCTYLEENHNSSLLYMSSASVFDGKFRLPSYENDKPFSETEYGKFKISVEKIFFDNVPAQTAILRLPMVLGVHSPRIVQLRQAIKNNAVFEVSPNLIISVTTANKIAQQVHYIINKKLTGIYHLSSKDMTHHEDLFQEIASKIGDKIPIFKSVFRRNEDTYLAILPKKNKLPETYSISVADVIEESTLNEEISTYKNQSI